MVVYWSRGSVAMCKVLVVLVEVGGLFLLAALYVFTSLTANFGFMKWRVSIEMDIHYSTRMVESKRNFANCCFDFISWTKVA